MQHDERWPVLVAFVSCGVEYCPFSDIGVVRADGEQVSYAGPYLLESAQYNDAQWFQAAFKADTYTSDVFLGLRGFPHFIVTARKFENGQPWILRATVDFLAFNDVVENIQLGQTGFAYIINQTGALQTRTAGRPVLEGRTYQELFNESDRLGEDDILSVIRKDSSGSELIYVAGMLKDNLWALILQQDKRDAYQDLNRTRNIAILDLTSHTVRVLLAVGDRHRDVRITPDGNYAVVCAMDANAVAIIDLDRKSVA